MEISLAVTAQLEDLRIAIVHYWFVGRAGGEKVVEALAEIFPQADLFSLVADQSTLAPVLRSRKLQTSFLQHVPGAIKFHRHFLFAQPLALEQFDLSGYDLVISSESGPAKGVITSSKTCHICYCHSPMRYIWDLYPEYRRGVNPLIGSIFALTAHYMRLWDYATAGRVDYFVANSKFIASRIRKYYGRESSVIYPPVETSAGNITAPCGEYYLAIGRLVDYKRFDLAIRACTELGRPLKIIGDGPQYKHLRRIAGPTIEFLGRASDDELRKSLAHSRALLFPGQEDFGIVPVEAQSFGRPVIAYASGGALETVRGLLPEVDDIEDPTGVFFTEQSTSKLVEAMLRFESLQDGFSAAAIRQHALQFDIAVFKRRIEEFIRFALHDFGNRSK
ncbi:MAG TPA: glycosyltransferase [Terracidiphilus sp.]|jgi:glycosyltransferase involved in cell wall biosynthesis|nr:glycosyltransferase [Terracidiphilus sp.]